MMSRDEVSPRDDHDVVVVGAGLAGLVAAVTAAEAGARVLLIEKQHEVGGTLPISSGLLFHNDPSRDPILPAHQLGSTPLVSGRFEDAASWLREHGVRLAAAKTKHGAGYRIDPDPVSGGLVPLLDRFTAAGGRLVTGVAVRELEVMGSGAVTGVHVRGLERSIPARRVVLATGGFQGSSELVSRYIAPWQRLFWRSNPGTTGDGLRMGLAAGAAATPGLDAFVGHLSPSDGTRAVPLPPEDYKAATLAFIKDVVVLNVRGERFVDESRQDVGVVRALSREPGAIGVAVFDAEVLAAHAVQRRPAQGDQRDAYQQWASLGARVERADSLEELFDRLRDLGLSAEHATQTMRSYDRAAEDGSDRALPVPRRGRLHRCATPPFSAMLVCPDITYTEGGLSTDENCRVLDEDGAPLPGLYAIGETAGLVSLASQAGGLATAVCTGIVAGTHLADSLDIETPYQKRSSA